MISKFIKTVLPYIVCIAAPFIALIVSHYKHKQELQEARDAANRAYITLDDDYCTMVYDTIRDTIVVAHQDARELSKEAYKDYADKSLLSDLSIRPKDVEQQQNTAVTVHDTIFLIPASDSAFSYKDKWASFDVSLKDTSLIFSVRDSLTTYIYSKRKHKFLWFRWGKKETKVDIVNHNPHATIDKNTVIFIK